MSSKGLFDAPEPIFGKEEDDTLPVATEENHVDDSDQFEDIGQSSYSAVWSSTRVNSLTRIITSTLTLSEDPGSALNDADDFDIQVRSGSPGSYTWSTATGWQLFSSFFDPDIPTIREMTARPLTTVPAGTYRIRLKEDAFGTNKPSTDIVTNDITVGILPTYTINLSASPNNVIGNRYIQAVIRVSPAGIRVGQNPFRIQRRSGSTWVADSRWTIERTVFPRSYRTDTVLYYPSSAVPAGTYRIIIPRGTLATNNPSTDIVSNGVTIIGPLIRNPTWGTPAYCSTSNRVTTTISFDGTPTGFTSSDIQVRNSANTQSISGWTHTITGSGSSYTVTSVPPRQINASFRLRLLQNSAQIGGVRTPTTNLDTILFTVDSRKQGPEDEMPAITIDSGSFCTTSRRITWQAYITGATVTQAGLLSNADTTINRSDMTVSVSETVTRSSSTSSSYQIQTSAIPTGKTGNMSVTIRANALGSNSNPLAVTSGCVYYDTSAAPPTVPSVTISAGGFDTSSNAVNFYIYWENTTETALDHSTNGFTRDDITVSGASGSSVNLGTRMGLAYPVWISNLPSDTNSNLKITIRANALGMGTNIATDSACVGYDTRTITDKPTVTISSGGFDKGSNAVYFYAYWENTTEAALTHSTNGFSRNDISVVGGGSNPTITLGSRMGLAYPISVSGLPANTNSNLKITIAANAIGRDTNEETDSPCVGYDTRVISETPVVTISSGGFDKSSNTVHFYAYWENTTVAALTHRTNGFTADDITVTGATGATKSLGSRMGLAYPISIGNLPSDTNSNLKITIAENALGMNTNEATDSPCVGYDTRTITEKPTVTISSGGFNDSDNTVYFYIYWENTTEAALDHAMTGFTSGDITIHGASGATATLGSRMGLAYPVTISDLPNNTNSNLKITVNENAIGRDTNEATDSPCVGYDTRIVEVPLVVTWDYANWCETSNKILASLTFNKAVTGLDVRPLSFDIQVVNERKNATLTGWRLSFSGHTGSGTNASLAANTPLIIEATAPTNTNVNVYMMFVMNSVTFETNQTGPGSNIYSEVIPVDNTPEEMELPDVTISAGSFDIENRQAYFHIYWENVTEAQLDNSIFGFVADDITVSGAEGATVSLGQRMGLSYPCHVTIPPDLTGNVKITIMADALGRDTNLSEDSPCIAYDTTTEATIENTPYLVVSGLPDTEQTGTTFTFTFTGEVDGEEINIADLTAGEFIVTAPDPGATITLS